MNATKKPKFSLFGARKKTDITSSSVTSIEFESVGTIVSSAPRGGFLVSTRLLLLVLSLMIPLGLVVFLLLDAQQQQINFASRERDGAIYLRDLGKLLQFFTDHRNLVSQVRASNSASVKANLAAEDARLEKRVTEIFSITDATNNRLGASLKSKESYERVKTSWQNIDANLASNSAEVNFVAHNRLIRTEMLDLIRIVANNSNLILDPSLDTYYTVDLTVNKLPTILDDLGQISGYGVGILSRKRIVEDEKFRMNAILSRVRTSLVEAERSASFASEANLKDFRQFFLQTSGYNRASTATLDDVVERTFIQEVGSLIQDAGLSGAKVGQNNNPLVGYPVASFVSGMNSLLKRYYELYDSALVKLNELLDRRVRGLQNTQRLELIAVLVVFLLVLVFAYLTARSITKPLSEMVGIAQKFGSGDLSETMSVQSRDEIGQLGMAFNNSVLQLRDFVDGQRDEASRSRQLQDNIGEFLNVAMDISGGDFTKKGRVSEDVLGNVIDAINLMTEEVGYLLKDVQATTEQVNSGARELTHASRNIVQGAVSQEEIAQQAQSQALEVSQQFEELTSTASDTAVIAQRTLDASREGQQAVQETLTGMNSIRREVSNISKSVKSLSDRSLEIQEIVDTISGIAAQTNLLSLNAAIEASGAGEAGARFAIVADEVRRLAEDSAKSTSRVAGLIKSIQTEIQGLVVGIEDGTKEVEQGYKIASQAGNQLEQIAQLAQQSSDFATRISEVTRNQVGRVQSVTQAVQTIAATAQSAREQSQSGQNNAEQLRQLAQNLSANLERFRLPA
jgi:twitching motility protein PilJ